MGSPVTIWSHICARGPGGMLPREKFDKNGAIWCNVVVPQFAITNRKTNNFKVTESTTTKHNRHMFHSDQFSDVHVM